MQVTEQHIKPWQLACTHGIEYLSLKEKKGHLNLNILPLLRMSGLKKKVPVNLSVKDGSVKP